MNQKTAERYVSLVDDYIGYIVDREPNDGKKLQLISYFFPDEDGDLDELTKPWITKQLNKIIFQLEKREDYELCPQVLKHLDKLNKLKD